MGTIRLGTCSWKYPSWEGLVYSSREPADFLAEYSEKYDAVEVDQWFWSLGKGGKAALPRPETVREYDAATPPDFRFVAKCPNALTLTRPYARGAAKGAAPEANPRFLDPSLALAWVEALGPLVPKVGLHVLQFEYLNKEKMPGGKAEFLDRLGPFLEALPADLPWAVEIRNPRWFDPAWLEFLRERRAAPVFLQGYWMDDAADLLRLAAGRLDPKGPPACLRLHGEDREGMEERTGEDWSRIVRPKDDELARLVPAARSLADTVASGIEAAEGIGLFLNINNHYEGSAPLTLGKVQALLSA
ncbi:MAG TPA: DUF72 domain-containing protein [Spirochaetales bacterium]|nr:DUF72 domain-containing protein [Spirochaetales bacterium]